MARQREASSTQSTVALALGGVALALVLALGAGATYLAVRMKALDDEMTQLRISQADLKDAFLALDSHPPAGGSAPPAPAPSAEADPSPPPDAPAPPAAAGNDGAPPPAPAAGASAAASATGAAQPQPAPASKPYVVRVFAPSGTLDKGKLDRFASTVRSLGFNVDISTDDVSLPMKSSMLFHPASADVANKLATSLMKKYSSMFFEMKPSTAINDNFKNVLIVNLNQDALK